MHGHRDIIRAGLQELAAANQPGRACWVTFDVNNGEHWLQCTPTEINMDWPFSSPPSESENLKVCFGRGGAIDIRAWDTDSYVTFIPADKDIETLIAGIHSTFQDLYEIGPDYTLTYKIEKVA